MLSGVAFGLAARGHQVSVITSRLRYDDPTVKLCAHARVDGVDVRRVFTSHFGRESTLGRFVDYLTFHISVSVHLLMNLRAGDIVVVKTDPPLLSVPVVLIARMKRAVAVNWLQDLFPEVLEAAGMRLGPAVVHKALIYVLRALRNWSLRMARWSVVIGEHMRENLIRNGIAAESLVLIGNWADTDSIRPICADDNPLRAAWGYRTDQVVIGYSGNMGVAHSLMSIVEAATLLREHPRIRFLFIGDGHYRAALEAQTVELGLTDIIQFQPYQPSERLAESLSVADVHLISLRASMEGLIVPSKFYCIAAAGRPMVFMGAADGEIARLIAQAKCGTRIPEDSPEALADCLLKLANDSFGYQAQGERARAFANSNHSQLQAIDRWEALIGAISTPA